MSDPREALLSRFRATLQARVRSVGALFDAVLEADSPEGRKQLLGELHTLKGESRMLGLAVLSRVAHGLEDHAAGELSASLIARALDAMRTSLDPDTPEAESAFGLEEILLELADSRLAASGEVAEETTTSASRAPSETPPHEDAAAGTRGERWVQVSARGVDDLCERVVELSAAFGALRTRTAEALARPNRDRNAEALLLEEFARCQAILDDSTTRAWSLRLVPIEPVLRELGQHARVIASRTGKEVDVGVRSGAVQLERDVLDQLWDPLLHLVQNAVDHGIESADERGDKPASGALVLSADASGPNVVIRVDDDGRGIDAELVRRRAIERGVLSPAGAAALSTVEVLQLIFDHGFSTRENVTDLSGRGIGLDVVKRKVESLGGNVSVETTRGMGTRFSLWVPYTVTRERVLIVSVADTLYGLPSRTVRAVLGTQDLPDGSAEQQDIVRHAGEPLPLLSLARALDLADETVTSRVLVLELAGRRFALQVPQIVGERELIRRPADALVARTSGIAASAILDDGRMVLLPELGFLHRTLRQPPERHRAAATAQERRKQHVLVVDDSPVVCDVIREILVTAGLTVETAGDGVAALEAIAKREPDLVLTDLEMPRMNGFELLAEIRKRSQRLPIIMLTTRGSTEDRQRATTLGANAYVLKIGFKSDTLLDVVGRFVRVS